MSHINAPARSGAQVVRHPVPVRVLHWLTAAAILAAYLLAIVRDAVEAPALDAQLLSLHRSFGLLLLGLTLVRAGGRAFWGLSEGEGSPLLRRLAALVHGLAYVLLFAVPLLGIALTEARGQAVPFFGIAEIPALFPRDRDLADLLEDIHGAAAWGLAALICVHAAAALYHHFILKDATLLSILPGRRGVTGHHQFTEAEVAK